MTIWDERVTRIEFGALQGARPRSAGRNARLPEHGSKVRVPLCRLTTSSGAQGIGLSRLDEGRAGEALGLPIPTLFSEEFGANEAWAAFDFALWDLAAKSAGVPVYQLIGSGTSAAYRRRLSVACYDTSLYFDDLLQDRAQNDHRQGADVVASEAAWGYEQGHRSFKVKVGRGPSRALDGCGRGQEVVCGKQIGNEERLHEEASGRPHRGLPDSGRAGRGNRTRPEGCREQGH